MKLALEALEIGKRYARALMMNQEPFDAAINALAEQPARQREPDLSGLKPSTQEVIKGWIEDGTFIERAIGAMQEQEAENMRLEKMAAPVQQEPVAWMTQARNFVPSNEFTKEEAKLYGWNALYTSPQPAQRKPLTPEKSS